VSDNNRRAKFYRLTDAGAEELAGERRRWSEMVEAVFHVLDAKPSEA
jgi:DNA-binding PadR family transcriptional regulator